MVTRLGGTSRSNKGAMLDFILKLIEISIHFHLILYLYCFGYLSSGIKQDRFVDKAQKTPVVMLLTRDPKGFWVPDCFLGPPRRLFWWPCLSSLREHVLDSFHFVSFLRIFKVKVKELC